MWQATKAGVLYFLMVFAAGSVLGTLRLLVMAPMVGETEAVILELPVILVISWFVCRWLVRRIAVPAVLSPRAVMGTVSFALLMVIETGLAVLAFQRPIGDVLGSYLSAAGMIGLAGQVAFALVPVVQIRVSRASENERTPASKQS